MATRFDERSNRPRGNPQPGQFEHHHADEYGHTSHSFHVPLCEHGLDDADDECDPVTAYFAAHAVVERYEGDECQEETAWGEGASLGNSWSMYFTHELHCEHDPCRAWSDRNARPGPERRLGRARG